MRAFLAIHPGPDLLKEVAGVQQNLRQLVEGTARRIRITWTRPETIHLTIKFLGDIDESNAAPLRELVESATRGFHTMEVPLRRIGAFPRDLAPRALWLGPPADWDQQEDANNLLAIVSAIDEASAKIGVPRDTHPWRPHLTLARVRDREREVGKALTERGMFETLVPLSDLRVDEVVLMKSDMRSDGPIHTKLWSVAL